MEQLMTMFGDVVEFLINDMEAGSGVLRHRLQDQLVNLKDRARIKMQLAACVEFGKPFAKSTYLLDGEGPLRLKAQE